MALLSLIALVAGSRAQGTVNLSRSFLKGEKLAYQVRSHITAESRQKGLQTWMPEDFDINYNFTTYVTGLKGDGIAVIRYQRPTMTEIEGETYNSGPKSKTENTNIDYELTVSPINELLEEKDLSAKDGKKKKSGSSWALATLPAAVPQIPFFDQFIGEMHRLALFVGGIDSSLDFAPKLPLEDVKVGDTWKRTVGYQPQKLKGKAGKSAVQRLDYTYEYKGITKTEAGKEVIRVQAKLNLNTDLGDFLKTLLGDRASETNIKKFPLHLKAVIDFDLDPKTKKTLAAVAKSEGGYGLFVEGDEDAYNEERFKGSTYVDLVGQKIIPVK